MVSYFPDVFRFADRDMLLRYLGGGIGHYSVIRNAVRWFERKVREVLGEEEPVKEEDNDYPAEEQHPEDTQMEDDEEDELNDNGDEQSDEEEELELEVDEDEDEEIMYLEGDEEAQYGENDEYGYGDL
jgi:hypothetical protein